MQEDLSSGLMPSLTPEECLDDSCFAEIHPPTEQVTPKSVLFHHNITLGTVTVKDQRSEEFLLDAELLSTPPLPIAASPRAARTGPIKTGGRVFVLDHSRWTDPMRNAIDHLLAKHHGSKDLLKQVDAEYTAMVQSACTDPNSLLHSMTKQHISRYIKHLAKKKNANASLNTSPEKLLETQQLWQHLDVKYFYCSKKVFEAYSAEGLTNPRMQFEDFAETPFFQRELEAPKQRGAERKRVIEERGKRKSLEEHPSGCLCRFCHQPLKQGPTSPHIHTGFPGVAGKYIYCPAKVLSLYQAQGMNAQMTWIEFQQSPFYEAERQRWIAEKKK